MSVGGHDGDVGRAVEGNAADECRLGGIAGEGGEGDLVPVRTVVAGGEDLIGAGGGPDDAAEVGEGAETEAGDEGDGLPDAGAEGAQELAAVRDGPAQAGGEGGGEWA